jgi:hypothetical protein
VWFAIAFVYGISFECYAGTAQGRRKLAKLSKLSVGERKSRRQVLAPTMRSCVCSTANFVSKAPFRDPQHCKISYFIIAKTTIALVQA